MPLTLLNYSPQITGKQIDTACKASANNPTGQAVWQGLIDELYGDFENNLNSKIDTYIDGGGILFAPVPENGLNCAPIQTVLLNVKKSTTAAKIDSDIKGFASGGGEADTLGPQIWAKVIENIFNDLIEIYAQGIIMKLDTAIPNVPPGAANPGNATFTSQVPALLMVPYIQTQLEAFLQLGLNTGVATGLGSALYFDFKAASPRFEGEDCQKFGEYIWDQFIDYMTDPINLSIETAIKMFLTIPGINWWMPGGIPGSLTISGAKPPSIPMPGTFM